MSNKYAAKCCHCQSTVRPYAGALSRQGNRWVVFCQSCAAGETVEEDPETSAMLRADREMFRRGISVTRLSSGFVGVRNAAGRCEDAPCCGCCNW